MNKLVDDRSMVVYLILAWFLGVFGAHRFYAGKTGSAIVMLILTCTIVGMLITCVWWLIDLIYAICNLGHPENIFAKK